MLLKTAFLDFATASGYTLQLFGIYRATSSLRDVRQQLIEWAKNRSQLLAPRNDTATADLIAPTPQLVASGTNTPPPNSTPEQLSTWTHENLIGIGTQTTAVLSELVQLRGEIAGERTQRNEADRRIEEDLQKMGCATWYVLIGTLLLAAAELPKMF